VSIPIKIPDLGAADDGVTLVRWLVDEGAEIVRGQKIAAIETDKATVELESVATGVLLKKCAAEGDDAVVGDVIAYVGKPGDEVPPKSDTEKQVSNTAATASKYVSTKVAPTADSSGEGKARVSSTVRNLAKQQGVDLDHVKGTGLGGIITRQDVLSAAKRTED
jgi:pyruvate/2-oxoglutarate dehydrogenase complex dihydrolipoamide acyltransferase (E2) component